MTTDSEDRSTWPRNGKPIRRDKLLRLIEKNHGPNGLDLRGSIFLGDGQEVVPESNPMDLSPEALAPLAAAYKQEHGDSRPPWLAGDGGIHLFGAQLQGAFLSGARLQGASLSVAQLRGADLMGAQLQGANLIGAGLQDANLIDAQLRGALLNFAQLQGANLSDAQLQGADLTSAQLERVDMYGVGSLIGARWGRAFLDYTRVDRHHLGQSIGDEDEARRRGSTEPEDKERKAEAYTWASEAYLLLKNNFNQIGRYEDASWAYVKEQQMEKMAYYWEWRSWGWKVWRAWGSLWPWLRNWAYELATGYGERPWNPVAWGGVVVLGFAVGFTRAIGNFWDALVYSIATFATFNLARFNTGPQGRGFEVASSLEALLGIALLALVVFTLGNRMSRS